MSSILVISRETEVFQGIARGFPAGYRLEHAVSMEAGLSVISRKRYDFVFADLKLIRKAAPDGNYKNALQPFWHLYPSIEIIAMSSQEMIREAVMAVKAGASDYITYPIDPDEVKHVTEEIYRSKIMQSELDDLRDRFWQADSLEIVQTHSPLMHKVFEKIRSVAPTKSTVLLIGETGTGKGVMARLIHRHSGRRDAQFIGVHCGAIPDTLLESELFGHEKGAFTGAIRRKLGKFEIARGGTIFLDEISTMTPSAQIKLLQVLQDGTFQRVGAEDVIEANVHVIAATNMDLKKMCDEGRFRKDLYYRLNVFPIEIPPLRNRLEDLPLLIDFFLRRINKFNPKEIHAVHPEVVTAFYRYFWPGNIRELENLMERAYILERSSVLSPESFPGELFAREPAPDASWDAGAMTLAEVKRKRVAAIEKSYLKELLSQKKGKISDAAAVAGITPRQLNKLMAKYGIRRESFKDPSGASAQGRAASARPAGGSS